MKDISGLEKTLGISFKQKNLLRQALVHRSYLNENPGFELEHNERLEFLGDAVLELAVTEHLYANFPNPEGELTNWRASLVRAENLAKTAAELNLGDYIYLSRGEAKDKNAKARNYILANAFEAVTGAIYLDHGYAAVQKFLTEKILSKLDFILSNKLYLDPKTRFQEASQEKEGVTPSYKVLEETGPDHNKQFMVGVFLGNAPVASGLGSSKQEAETEAAKAALAEKGWE